jgi:hypothetical protein
VREATTTPGTAGYLSPVNWTRGAVRLITASGAAVLVAGGLGLAVRSEPGQASFVGSGPVSPTIATAPAPTQQVPAAPVTLTSRPTPTRVPTSAAPKPSRSPKPTATPPASAASLAPTPPRVPVAPPTLDFTLSSFNVLGSSHTSGTGKGKKAGMAPGSVRARWAAQLIRRHRAEVIGFQELQSGQLAILRRHTNLEFFPGSSMGRADSENSIGWRRDRWEAVETRTVTVPYFNGNGRQMPYVRLRNLATGLEAWFANFHNPADTRRFSGQQRFRSRATDIEVALANRLLGDGTPVFITGDMNDRDAYFCRLTGGAPMVAARGGSNNGVCRPENPRAVDWIFGSQGVTFTGYLEDRSALVNRTSDHPMLVARVRLVGDPTDFSALPGAISSD